MTKEELIKRIDDLEWEDFEVKEAKSEIRMGSGDQRATEMEVMQMYHDQSFGIRSELSIPETNMDMLNMDTLHSYRAYLNVDGALPQCKDMNDEEFCKKLNILDAKGLLTYAGLLMFGKSPYVTAYVPTFCMDYIEIPGPTVEAAYTRYTYRIPEQENLWESYLIIYRRLRTLIDTPFKLDSDRGVNVEDKRQWDILREALANMCMHTDHFSPVRSCIHAFTDKIEFMNAGSLPMPAEQMVRTFYSSLRNPTIAKLFRFANISENVGFGMGKLFSWKQLMGNEVTCESDRNVVRVTFFLKNNLDKVETVNPTDELELDVKTLQKRLGEKLGVKLGIKLGINQMSILLLLHFYPRITRNELSQLLEFSFTSVDVNLNKLKELHLLERVGARKNGYWQINLESENDVNKSEM